MRITRKLIEKYHQGLCTPEERSEVEAWLFDDTRPDAELPSDDSIRTLALQEEIWDGLTESISPGKGKTPLSSNSFPWGRAAAVLLLAAGLAFYLVPEFKPGIMVVSNTSSTLNKDLEKREYSIMLGPLSDISIDEHAGRINLCGTVMILPKQDMELTIRDACAKAGKPAEKITLKKGQNYFALNYGSGSDMHGIMVLHREALNGLPPLVQRQLMRQFNI